VPGHRSRIVVELEPARVWSFVACHENWAGVFPGYQAHRSITDGRSRWTVKADLGMFSRVVEVDVAIVAEQPPDRVEFTVDGVSESFSGRGAFGLSRAGQTRSELTLEIDVLAGGPMAPMINALVKPRLPGLLDGFARALARRLEECRPADSRDG
jgi:carbon monoxide dehydrogenase subunit G